MLKNYGNVFCKGRSEPLGINGWYANGQVWAYLEGAIGIKVNLMFIKGHYEILRVGAAAVLQAKLPNPFWMRGVIGGRYRILGGLVSGNCRFQFEIGKECEIIDAGSPVENIQVISETTPNDGATNVNVFNVAQAIFNMPINKPFELQDIDGKKISYQIQLDHFRVKNGSQEIKGQLEWNTEKDVLAFNSFDILPSEKQLTLEVQVSFKENKNGSWQTVTDNGKPITETLQTSFKTGAAPDYIPISNVKYSYPLPMMLNYYQNESDIGYIQLDKGQPELFSPGNEWKQIGRFIDKQGNKHEFNFTYNTSKRKIDFKRPGNLQNNAIYSFKLVNVPAQAKGAIDKNVTTKIDKKELVKGNESTLEIKTKKAEGSLTILEEKNIFETNFRTSKYNTLSAKIDGLSKNVGAQYPLRAFVHIISIGVYGGETFDNFEVNGNDEIAPLIQFTHTLQNNSWYEKYVYPYLYKDYPNPFYIKNRQTEPIGIPPLKTVNLFISKGCSSLTEDDILYGAHNTDIGYASFKSHLIHYSENDYNNISSQACAKYFGHNNLKSNIKYLLEKAFHPVTPGEYKFKVMYALPGINTESSSKTLTIKLD